MLTCRQATQLLSEQQDRQLLLKEQSGLQFHLMMCRSCRTSLSMFLSRSMWKLSTGSK